MDHAILLQRLDVAFGLKDTVLQWIRSFLTGRTQQVAYCGRTSSVQPVLFVVPHDPHICSRKRIHGYFLYQVQALLTV